MPKKPRKRQQRPGLRTIARLFLAPNGRFYWKPEARLRPHWQSVALGDERDTAEAVRLNGKVTAWLKKASEGKTRARPAIGDRAMTFGQLIELYKQSTEWKMKRPRTIVTYTYELQRLSAEFGHEVAARLSASAVHEWLEELRFTAPGTARHLVARGRALMAWATRKGYVGAANPFAKQRTGGGGKRSVRMTWDDVKLLAKMCDSAANARPSIGHILVIGFCCIQRVSDVIALDRPNIVPLPEGGARLRFHQSKGRRVVRQGEETPGFFVDMAWPAACSERLASIPERRRKANCTALIVNERLGQPWEEHAVARAFRRILDKAIEAEPEIYDHLKGVQLRDARRSGFVHRIENGATIEQTTAISGHSVEEGYRIVEHYMPRTAKMADAADRFLKVAW